MLLVAPTTVPGKGSPVRPEYAALDITPADGTDIALGPNGTKAIGLIVTGAGNVNVDLDGGGTAVLTSLVANTIYVVGIQRIRSTSTTATGIRALYAPN